MIRRKSKRIGKPVIDLTGPEGNAYCLMGYAKKWAEELGIEWVPIRTDMMSGNYEHLLSVIEKHFGDYVILER